MKTSHSFIKNKTSLIDVLSHISTQLCIDDFNIIFVIEEIITNTFEHSKKTDDYEDIGIAVTVDSKVLSIQIENIIDYDFLGLTKNSKSKALDYKLTDFGGLGLGLIVEMTREQKYLYANGTQYYTFVFA